MKSIRHFPAWAHRYAAPEFAVSITPPDSPGLLMRLASVLHAMGGVIVLRPFLSVPEERQQQGRACPVDLEKAERLECMRLDAVEKSRREPAAA